VVTAVDRIPTGQYDLTSKVRKNGRIPATEFKAKCLELMDRVAERRESFVITKRGRPVARLVPMDRKPKDSIFGWLRGQAWERGDIVAPATSPDEWTTLTEWDALNATKPAGRRRRRGPGGKRK
jgi:prevent-host-death family protein